MSRAGIDLFTPEGDPHAIPRRRHAAPRTGGRDPFSASSSLPCCASPVVYFSPLTVLNVFVCGRHGYGAFMTAAGRLNSRIYELHRRRGTARPAESLPMTKPRKRVHMYMRERICVSAGMFGFIYRWMD